MFGKKSDKQNGGVVAREKTSVGVRPVENAISIIGPGMRIVGDVITDGTVRVEGRVEGTLRAGKGVVLGKEGEVVGDILTQDAVIGGRVQGRVVAESRLEMQATCEISGEIRARASHLQLHEGARFNGQIQMIDGEEARALPPATGSTGTGGTGDR
jgi:cytoskeletal protein CcmA (bactofilin family)